MKYITSFHSKKYLGNKDKLGGKGSGLKTMASLKLPVPSGFVITTDAWQIYNKTQKLNEEIKKEIVQGIRNIEKDLGRKFAEGHNMFLVSIRSGSKFSMPGMMDSILNVGLNVLNYPQFKAQFGDNSAAAQVYSRFIQSYAKSVFNIEVQKEAENKLKCIIPSDPIQQVFSAVESVFRSWNNPGAISYRQRYGIPDSIGTAVNVQIMVFGNKKDSGSGVLFSRNTDNGAKELIGDFGSQMQGEEIVNGKNKRKTIPIPQLGRIKPKLHKELSDYVKILEKEYQEVQDIEFTVESGKLWLLQTRKARRSPLANIIFNIDLYREGLISREKCYKSILPSDIRAVQALQFIRKEEAKAQTQSLFSSGRCASTGVAVGKLALSLDDIELLKTKGDSVIYATDYIDQDDFSFIARTDGIITLKGSPSSHIAIILKSLGIPSIVGCSDLIIDKDSLVEKVSGRSIKRRKYVSINASKGYIYNRKILISKQRSLSRDILNELQKRQEIFGNSTWSSALYENRNVPKLDKLIKEYTNVAKQAEKKWLSPKAVVIALLNKAFEQETFNYKSELHAPDDTEGIRQSVKKVIGKKKVTFLRTCLYPHPLGVTPYSSEISKMQDLEDFFENPNYPGKYGGYKKWLKDKSLKAIEVLYDMRGKLDKNNYSKHFACTLVCTDTNPPMLEVNLSLNHPHLREMENMGKDKLVVIRFALGDEYALNLGDISYQIGISFIDKMRVEELFNIYKNESHDELISDLSEVISRYEKAEEGKKFDYENFCHMIIDLLDRSALPDSVYRKIIKKDVLSLIDQVVNHIRKLWGEPYFLPYKMWGLDSILSLGILEAQGRFENDKLKWFKIYGAKGYEERERLK